MFDHRARLDRTSSPMDSLKIAEGFVHLERNPNTAYTERFGDGKTTILTGVVLY